MPCKMRRSRTRASRGSRGRPVLRSSASARSLYGLQRWFIPWAAALLAEASSGTRVTSARRSYTEQARLYRRYLAGQSQYPAAPPGQSKHERGLAFDIVTSDEELRRLGGLWESWGGIWGGRS